jgi:ABC-type transporter Mla MlaB component
MHASTPRPVALAIRGPILRTDLPGLCARVCELLGRSAPRELVCDVAGVEPDAVTVDALARLQLAAKSHGCRVRLLNATPELSRLVGFMGLADVLTE